MTYYERLPSLYDGYTQGHRGMPGITSTTSGGSGRLIAPFKDETKVAGPHEVPWNCRCPWVPRYPGRRGTYAFYQRKFSYTGCRAHAG